MLIPYGFTGQKVYEGSSEISGEFVVKDVDVGGATHRRLVFLDDRFLVQSEAKLKTVKRKNKSKLVVDFGYIPLHHSFMCVGVQLAKLTFPKVAVLGLGGGSLCMFLRKCYDDLKVTAVDLDPVMLNIAKDYFELQIDENLEVQIKDGLDFLKDEAKNGNKYGAVMFDMDSKDRSVGLSCPPRQFLDDHVLDDAKKILTDDGHFILNLICRDTQLHESILDSIKRHFKHITTVKLYEEVNEIVFATNSSQPYNNEDFDKAVRELNAAARQKKLVDIRCVDLKDFMQSVVIVS